MSAPSGPRASDTANSGRSHGLVGADMADLGDVRYPCSIHRDAGYGPLGLEGVHREVADLIRCGEVLAVRGDERTLRDIARRVVQTLRRHIDKERPGFEHVDAAERRKLLAGQEAVLEYATRFATNPTPDVGADLLALLVRQADTEEAAAVHAAHEEQPASRDQVQFTTDWAIAPPLVALL